MLGKEFIKDGRPGLPLPLEDCEVQRCVELVSWGELDAIIEVMMQLCCVLLGPGEQLLPV